MIELALTAGVPVVCGLVGALWMTTRTWRPRYAEARRHYDGRRRT